MYRVGLVAGNGLCIDLRRFLCPSLERWDTQKPLDWRLLTPGKQDTSLFKSLPRFAKAIEKTKQEEKKLSDFDIFDRISRHLARNSPLNFEEAFEKAALEEEMRHFLAIAYSHFQLHVDSHDIEGWSWLTWLRKSKRALVYIISFNYDLVLERALDKSGVQFRRFGVRKENTGILMLKPHGSIDFDVEGINMPVGYPLENVASKNNFPLRCLDESELLQPRTEVDIVLPKEYSPYLDFQWVGPGYKCFNEIGFSLTQCIFAGLSYWECDRQEIDFLLESLAPDVELIVANPKPPTEFLAKAEGKFQKKVRIWKDGPE